MAEFNPALTPPRSTARTELYYAITEDTNLKQVFGVQDIPTVDTPPEDITYRTLESSTEFAVPGVRPYETIQVPVIYYEEQFEEMRKANENGDLWWYVKLPDATSPTGTNPIVIKWRGALSVSVDGIELDNMLQKMLTIGKSTVPEIIKGLPTA